MTPEVKKLYDERWARMDAALHHKRPADRLPVIIMGHIPSAKMMDPEVVPADIVERPEYFLQKAFEGYESLKDVDALNALSAYSHASGVALMSNCKIPGIDIGRTEILQIDEHPFMPYEDYQKILDTSWGEYKNDYIANKLHVTPEDMMSTRPFMKRVAELEDEHGYIQFGGGGMAPGCWDALSAMRGMNHFFRDLRKDPQLIKDVMAKVDAEGFDQFVTDLKKNAETRAAYAVMLQPGVRANCDFVSRKTYEEFLLPYLIKWGNAIVDTGNVIHFHYDAKWDDFLDMFDRFPEGTAIFDSDGLTDIYKVKDILGKNQAITGNVPAALLAIGTPDEVYNYTVKQIHEIGPEGYYVCSSCTIPANCKPENLRAMVAAARD